MIYEFHLHLLLPKKNETNYSYCQKKLHRKSSANSFENFKWPWMRVQLKRFMCRTWLCFMYGRRQ